MLQVKNAAYLHKNKLKLGDCLPFNTNLFLLDAARKIRLCSLFFIVEKFSDQKSRNNMLLIS